MTIPSPEHLLDQADHLRSTPVNGAPRQVDLKRAMSATYYALFHAIVADVAHQIAGAAQFGSAQHSLVYRSVKHRELKTLCENITKPNIPPKYKAFEPQAGFGPDLIKVGEAVLELQEKRHKADYDPLFRVSASAASLNVQTGRAALQHWRNVPKTQRRLFILMLVFLR